MVKKKIFAAAALVTLLLLLLITVHVSSNSTLPKENDNNSKAESNQNIDIYLFNDVNENDWFYEYVKYVNENGLMNGTSKENFSPYDTATRGMLVTILWRLDGEPAETGKAFSDVKSDTYYYNAILWAFQNGIVNGETENTFCPDDNITREQLAAIIYRYASYKKYDTSKTKSLYEYRDVYQISDYAVSAMQWANAAGLITGMSEETLEPQGNALRCQIAAILKRFCTNIIPSNPADEADTASKTEQPIGENNKTTDENNSSDESASHGENSDSSDSSSEQTDNNSNNGNSYPIITVNNTYAKAGDEVGISITLNNNPGILGMALTAYYDEENLMLESVENGEAFQNILDLTTSQNLISGARFLWDGIDVSDADIKDGTVLIMNFKVNSDAQAGKYPITLKYSDDDIVDKNLKSISPQIESGYIIINN